MDRLSDDRFHGLPSLLVFSLAALLGLRLLDVALPLVFPDSAAGPFHFESLAAVEEELELPTLAPFYRPARLGVEPVAVSAWRWPEARIETRWEGERRLLLRQGGRFAPPPSIATVEGEMSWWRDGRWVVVRRTIGALEVEVRTDLPIAQALLIADSLRPVGELG